VYARTTQLEIDTVRISVDDALQVFEQQVMPVLREQPGYRGVYVFSTPEGRALLISFWDTSEQADATADTGWYPAVLEEYVTLFRSPPGREHYEVRLAAPPVTADST
jgi:hypothetical protein